MTRISQQRLPITDRSTPNPWFLFLRGFAQAHEQRYRPLSPLTENQILAWADDYCERHGEWPDRDAGPIPNTNGESWMSVEAALEFGLRGLPGHQTVARLLLEMRGRRHRKLQPVLTEEKILHWADKHHRRTGKWPTDEYQHVEDAPGEIWSRIDNALTVGLRGLFGGSSLAELLQRCRKVRNIGALPPLSIKQILRWADAYRRRTGTWPLCTSGPIPGAPLNESWLTVDKALRRGTRGCLPSSSLARLLQEQRGVRNLDDLPPLTPAKILEWADAFRRQTGRWPRAKSGPVLNVPGESWLAISASLRNGSRGLPGGSSLAQLLAKHRQVAHRFKMPRLKVSSILRWIDAFRARTGRWPNRTDGAIPEAPGGETWYTLHSALKRGARGLSGTSSLPQFLEEHRGVRNSAALPPFSIQDVLAWADAFHARTGNWPRFVSGPVAERPEDTWKNVDGCLRKGMRGLPGGSSLARLLSEQRGVWNIGAPPRLTVRKILAWADKFHQETGRWPNADSGPIPGTGGDTWAAIDAALMAESRGLKGKSSLARLLALHRGKRNHLDLPRYRQNQIMRWIKAYHREHDEWPTVNSGPIANAPGETWMAVDMALRKGHRGLHGGSSLAMLLDENFR